MVPPASPILWRSQGAGALPPAQAQAPPGGCVWEKSAHSCHAFVTFGLLGRATLSLAATMNTVNLIGNLATAVELKQLGEARCVASFVIAIDRAGRDGADFVRVAAWNKQAEACAGALRKGERLAITFDEVLSDTYHSLGTVPGLRKVGVEAHLQELLAIAPDVLGAGMVLVRREYPTDIGPVDLLCRDGEGTVVAVEVKRRGEIDGVEQLTRYLELLNRDPLLAPVKGVFAAQEIKPQARVLATDRGIGCVVLDYDAMRGIEDHKLRLF